MRRSVTASRTTAAAGSTLRADPGHPTPPRRAQKPAKTKPREINYKNAGVDRPHPFRDDCQSGPASALTWEIDFRQVAAVQFDAVQTRSRLFRLDGCSTFAPP